MDSLEDLAFDNRGQLKPGIQEQHVARQTALSESLFDPPDEVSVRRQQIELATASDRSAHLSSSSLTRICTSGTCSGALLGSGTSSKSGLLVRLLLLGRYLVGGDLDLDLLPGR